MSPIAFWLIALCILQATAFNGHKLVRKISIKLSSNQISLSALAATPSISDVSSLQVKTFLNTVLSSRSAVKDRQVLIEQLQGLRDDENDGSIDRSEDRSTPAVWNGNKESFLNEMLNEIDKVNGIVRFLPRFLPSYRVKLLILKSLMGKILSEDVSPSDKSRQRRALSMILGQLRNSSIGIRELIQEESKRSKLEQSFEEMLSRTPNLETPEFNIVYNYLSSKSSHVRKYYSFSVCSLVMDEQVAQTGGGAFNFLAGYIFGKNKNSEKMAMTTPVISQSSERKMSFVMPSAYWKDISNAPAPVNDIVKLESKPLGEDEYYAVTWFGGYANKVNVDKKTNELISIIENDQKWKIKDAKPEPIVLQYNGTYYYYYTSIISLFLLY